MEISHPVEVTPSRNALFLAEPCGYPPSDRPVFLAGYSELCRANLNGKVALEICSGWGALAAQLARVFPAASVTALDQRIPPDGRAGWHGTPNNLQFRAGSAFDLSFLPTSSVELVWGQAALHHLASSPEALCDEIIRVLTPGGRLVFVFEPMGHNVLVAMLRAARVSLSEEPDESNLFLSQIERMAERFSRCEVQMFNLLAYPLKGLSDRWSGPSRFIQRVDSFLFRKFPSLLRYGANCNIIFTK
jgi:SAM-dependent methyltransferase